MRQLLLVATAAACFWAHVASAKPLENDLTNLLEDKEESYSDNAAGLGNKSPIAKRDVGGQDNEALVKLLLSELIKELKKQTYYERMPAAAAGFEDEDLRKRNAFWQPIGGPLPVNTRLASFGTKIEPDGSRASSHAFKAMRYGRRRR